MGSVKANSVKRRPEALLRGVASAAAVILFASYGYAASIVDNNLAFTAITDLNPVVVDEFSGISHVGGNLYYGVSDNEEQVYPITIDIDLSTGAIQSAQIGVGVALNLGVMPPVVDLEGIAFDRFGGGNVLIADEGDFGSGSPIPMIREHNPATGVAIGTVAIPDVFDNPAVNGVRTNFSLESVSLGAGALWTANEEALKQDGPVSSIVGEAFVTTTVRLQRFTKSGGVYTPDGQWAYEVDPINGDFPFNFVTEQSGVGDLLALPNGELLVLERSAGLTGFRSRLYGVTPGAGATDTSSIVELDGASFTPIKTSAQFAPVGPAPWLWERTTIVDNFEGITLGPQLENGMFTLILVSDGTTGATFGPRRSLYVLAVDDIATPGDANLDGVVGLDDLVALAANYTVNVGPASWHLGDFNHDGVVDETDLALIAANFGSSASSDGVGLSVSDAAALAGLSVADVPEPVSAASFGLVGVGLIAGTGRAGRRTGKRVTTLV